MDQIDNTRQDGVKGDQKAWEEADLFDSNLDLNQGTNHSFHALQFLSVNRYCSKDWDRYFAFKMY